MPAFLGWLQPFGSGLVNVPFGKILGERLGHTGFVQQLAPRVFRLSNKTGALFDGFVGCIRNISLVSIRVRLIFTAKRTANADRFDSLLDIGQFLSWGPGHVVLRCLNMRRLLASLWIDARSGGAEFLKRV
jgi:hypothetical protein